MCVKVSEGEAYVKGYDVTTDDTSIVDVDKPRDTKKIDSGSVPFFMGNNIIVNNLSGQPQYRGVIDLYGELQQGTGVVGVIGKARVYSVTPRTYQTNGQASTWNVRLYDIQMYDRIALNDTLASSGITTGYYVRGKNSGAQGYSDSHGTTASSLGLESGTNWINVTTTSGKYIKNEEIQINGESKARSITEVVTYSGRDIKLSLIHI